MARLNMVPKAFFIWEYFHAARFCTYCFHCVQLNCNNERYSSYKLRTVIYVTNYYRNNKSNIANKIRTKIKLLNQLTMGSLVSPQLWFKSKHLSTANFLAYILLLRFNSCLRGTIVIMEFFDMPSHVPLERKFNTAVINRALEQFSLVLKKMAR